MLVVNGVNNKVISWNCPSFSPWIMECVLCVCVCVCVGGGGGGVGGLVERDGGDGERLFFNY